MVIRQRQLITSIDFRKSIPSTENMFLDKKNFVPKNQIEFVMWCAGSVAGTYTLEKYGTTAGIELLIGNRLR
jgi:hypothetical protein